jgi:hypothetical protein
MKTGKKENQKIQGDEKNKSTKGAKGKGKNEPREEEEPQGPPPEKPLNLERFIYITTYYDSNFMQVLKKLFEEINQAAFNLRSVKEIYTRGLSDEERDNNEIDYISGFQIIDKNLRITILEGITGKGMKKVKEYLPKTQMNSKTLMIFADSNVLFNKRLYSKFDLSLKYIKLRDNLSNILQTYDIYTKANKYKQIYDSFLNFGSILKAETLKEISNANLFPDAESLLLLERKYADILNDEDMTGVHKDKKKKRRMKIDALTKTSTSGFSGRSSSKKTKRSESFNESGVQSLEDKKKDGEEEKNIQGQPKENQSIDNVKKSGGTLLDTRNLTFDNLIKERTMKRTSSEDTCRRNINYIRTMKRKPHEDRFCMPSPYGGSSHRLIMYGNSRANHYEEIINGYRQKYIKDTKHFYTYSNYGLTLNFPMIERDRNEKYLNYIENKSKWFVPNTDFDRYKQPAREKFYFPKINNIL